MACSAAGCANSLWSGPQGLSSAKSETYDQYSKDYQSRSLSSPGMGLDNDVEPGRMQKIGSAVAAVPAEVGSSLKSGAEKVTGWVTPASATTDAAGVTTTSIFAKKKEASPQLHLATARMYESRGEYAEAATQYDLALKDTPNDVATLLSYGHLMDHQGKLPEATKLYQRAVKANPREPAAYNDLGLCLARRGNLNDAMKSVARASQLAPDRALYRNNLATLLVEQHKTDEALAQLRSVHDESIANYNLAVMLHQHKQDTLATVHFQRALELNPSFNEARDWLAQLAMGPAASIEIAGNTPSAPPIRMAAVPQPSMNNGSYNAGGESGPMYAGQQFAPAAAPAPVQIYQPQFQRQSESIAIPPSKQYYPAQYSQPQFQPPQQQMPPQTGMYRGNEPMPPTPDNLGNYQPAINSELHFQY
ncbi:MAG TPA: tetratricopeptide repeat protein [Pirellulales bacterium]